MKGEPGEPGKRDLVGRNKSTGTQYLNRRKSLQGTERNAR